MNKFFYILIAFLLAACGSTPATQNQVQNIPSSMTVAPAPSSTYTLTPLPTDTPIPTTTPTPLPTHTPTPLPTEVQGQLLQTYKFLVFIELNVNLLNETATRVNSGELSGPSSFGTILALSIVVNAVEEGIPDIVPLEDLKPYWEDALAVHAGTKDILSRWLNDEIDSAKVMEEIGPFIEQIDKINSDAEHTLSKEYGFDSAELASTRDGVMQSIGELFATPTPTAVP